MSPSRSGPPATALPWGYWLVFGLYEPLLAICGFVGALADPKGVRSCSPARVCMY